MVQMPGKASVLSFGFLMSHAARVKCANSAVLCLQPFSVKTHLLANLNIQNLGRVLGLL